MGGPDDEFDDFLTRRKPVFRRADDDVLEPPAELDRIVLRQAREAIEIERPQRVFRGPRWGAPLALAATLLLAFTIILQVGKPQKQPRGEVTVENVAQRLDPAAAASPAAPGAAAPALRADTTDNAAPAENAADGRAEVVVDLADPARAKRETAGAAPQYSENRARAVEAPQAPTGYVSEAEADRHAPAPPPPPTGTRSAGNAPAAGAMSEDSTVVIASPPPSEAQRAVAKASSVPAWRRDQKTWLAEIDRLRAEGKNAEADAELAHYKREHRPYAGSPDR